ncbi:MAG: YebC/PmpR family DNA-binding transcriptional regulator [Ruminococcaceae bacterium]|nr:YebC/PmpR family DNA-binding transcriptional regulator [Oscillospiraceae bacterium]
MSGHSKWKNIMHKKEKTDAQRAKVFTKIGKEIAVAVKEGGADPTSNSKLRDIIAKAKSNNVPNDNIDRIIKKASSDDANYDVIYYEGYGPSGIAVMVEATTDNRNRTSAEVRHYFDKFGGNMGAIGCVSFMFTDKGVIIIENDGIDEDKLMEDALDAGAEDVAIEEELFEITTAPADLSAVSEALTAKGYTLASAEATKIPSSYSALESEEDITMMNRLLDSLDDNEDVTNVWHNWDN